MGAEKYCVIAKIGAPYGVKGELKLHSFTDPYEKLLDYPTLFLQDRVGFVPMPVHEIRMQGNSLLISFPQYPDRDLARRFVNQEIAILKTDLPTPDAGEYYWADLEGLQVITREGRVLGVVDQVFNAGASDILDVKGDVPTLVPFIPPVILNVDLTARVITVDWDPDF